jgi:signal transduction histidine kinase
MAAALEELDRAKSEFVENASHELRTPLTAMQLSIANLRDGVAGPPSPRQAETLARLARDTERLIRLVNDLLELARLEAGAVELRAEDLALETVALDCVAALEPLARKQGLAVEVSGRGAARADRGVVQRIVTNLLDNAIKFTPQGGRIAVRVADARVEVVDTGPGFADLALFDKFRQGRTAEVKHAGAGLGLAIAKKLAARAGGTIELAAGDLQAGRGARLTVRLGDGA